MSSEENIPCQYVGVAVWDAFSHNLDAECVVRNCNKAIGKECLRKEGDDRQLS
jgi:hypothetical protein